MTEKFTHIGFITCDSLFATHLIAECAKPAELVPIYSEVVSDNPSDLPTTILDIPNTISELLVGLPTQEGRLCPPQQVREVLGGLVHVWVGHHQARTREVLGQLVYWRGMAADHKKWCDIHLTNNLAYVLMLILSLMMPFALRIRVDHGMYQTLLLDLPFFVGATISVCTFYVLSQREAGGNWRQRILCIPFVLALGIGLAVNNAVATFEAIFGHQSPFVRTPKLAVEGKTGPQVKGLRYRGGRNLLPIVELYFAAVYTHTLFYCVEASLWFALPFMLLFQLGFLYTGLMSLFQWTALRRRLTEAPA